MHSAPTAPAPWHASVSWVSEVTASPTKACAAIPALC